MAVDIGELRGIITLQDQFSGPIEKVAGALGISSKSFSAMAQFAGLAAGAVTAAAGAIVYLGDRGSAVDDVRSSFAGFAQEANSTADIMLGALRSATDGTISDFDLMKMSGNALGAGLVKTKDDMATLAAGARLLADRTGGDTKEAFDQLTGAMESGRTKTLASMGVFIDAEKVVKDYAKANNITVESLNKQERAQIVSQATLAALRAELVRSGEVQADFSDRIAQGKVAVQNFVDNLGLAIAKSPVVAAGMDAIAKAMQGAFGGSQQQAVQTIMGYVNDFAIFMVDLAEIAATTARVIVAGFDFAKIGLNGVLQVFSQGVTAVADRLADFIAKASELPLVGEKFAGMAAGWRGVADAAHAAAIGFDDVKQKALTSADESEQFFDRLDGGLASMRTAMVAAQGAAVDLAVTNEGTSQSFQEIAGAAVQAAKDTQDAFEIAAEAAIRENEITTEVAATRLSLQQQIALANTSGLEQRLMQIEIERQAEIDALAARYGATSENFEQLSTLTNEKYALMTQAAQGFHQGIVAQANAAGFQTRAQLEATAANALDTYTRMLDSGKFTYAELQRAHKAAKDAEDKINQSSALTAKQQFELIASAAKTLLGAVFGNSKIAAIAVSLIDTAQAVVKALASAPPPLNFGLAAAVGAAGLVQTNKIRSTNASFAEGTLGTRFEDFGRGTAATLHGHEAVVNRKQAGSLAEMLEGAVLGHDMQSAAELRGLRQDMRDRDRELPILLRDASRLAAA